MIRVHVEGDRVQVPAWVSDLESFRRWSDDDAFPEVGQISYLQGDVWVDMSKEQLFWHNDAKSEINTVVRALVRAEKLGRYFTDGAFVSNADADVSNQPDGVFVSAAALRRGRVRVVEGRSEGHVELEGSPDMVLEVVSGSSVEKDAVFLRRAYAAAGIREYWLVDARPDPPRFDLLRLGRGGYSVARAVAGWVRSDVFGRWFRLTRDDGQDGYPEYTFAVRTAKPA